MLEVSSECAVRNQPQRPPSQHDSMTVWHLGHSRCARTKIGASVVPQYGQRGGSTLAGVSSVALSDCISVPPKCAVRSVVPAGWPIEIRVQPNFASASGLLLLLMCWPFVFIMCFFPDKGLHSLIVFVFCDLSIRWQRLIRNASR